MARIIMGFIHNRMGFMCNGGINLTMLEALVFYLHMQPYPHMSNNTQEEILKQDFTAFGS